MIYTATLKNGNHVEFVYKKDPPSGAMKKTYFSPDGTYVVQFYINQMENFNEERLEAILTRYNPTVPEAQGGAKGASNSSAEYFKKLFSWPIAIVTRPQAGLMAPAYTGNYYFKGGPFKGKEKFSKWFTSPKLKTRIPDDERGDFRNYLKISSLLARAVRRLHSAGLAHSDLSPRNVIIDPANEKCNIIDIDSLVVPKIYPPDVLGTPGYIAPEVLKTQDLPFNSPQRYTPSIRTDLHALSVLIYELLLGRHPLVGPKINSTASSEEDEYLSMGEKALFIENYDDNSNRPENLDVTFDYLGPYLKDLIYRAFVRGLHSPKERPGAVEWERGLVKTMDLLLPCNGEKCINKWFIACDTVKPVCPFCKKEYEQSVPLAIFRSERRPGLWMKESRMFIHNKSDIYLWHVYDNLSAGEDASDTPVASFFYHRKEWVLCNKSLNSLILPDGSRLLPGHGTVIEDGFIIKLSSEPHSRIMEIKIN